MFKPSIINYIGNIDECLLSISQRMERRKHSISIERYDEIISKCDIAPPVLLQVMFYYGGSNLRGLMLQGFVISDPEYYVSSFLIK